jgi:hypothetical protein
MNRKRLGDKLGETNNYIGIELTRDKGSHVITGLTQEPEHH